MNRWTLAYWIGLSSMALLACSATDSRGGDEGVESLSNGDGVSTGSGDQGTASGGETSADGGTTGQLPGVDIKFDLGLMPDVPESEGCKKIDFLFVIDNSGSMTAQQTQLLNSYPGFISAIQATLSQVDSYHVGVITSDNYTPNAPGCQTLGDLVTQTGGGGSSMATCTPFADGNRFMTENDDLPAAFDCAARVGTFGSGTEQPVTGLVNALDPVRLGPGGCNEGFLRDDAVLVVVIVTDDPPASTMDDAHPNTDTTGWIPAVVAAKNGDPDAMTVIGLVPWTDISCVPLTMESPNLINFVQGFNNHVIGSVCEPDYAPFFADAIATIESTCTNFEG